jgi:hypothetical protein
LNEFDMENANTVSMPMGLNVIQHESNDGLVINEQNGISNATYISKLLDAAHSTRPDIIYATATMVPFAKNLLQENWTGVKRILRYLKGTIDFALTCGQGGIGNQSSPTMWMQMVEQTHTTSQSVVMYRGLPSVRR